MWYDRKDSYTAQHTNTYKEESIINYNSPLPVGVGGSNFTLSEFFLILRGFHLALHSFTLLNTVILRGCPGNAAANKPQPPTPKGLYL